MINLFFLGCQSSFEKDKQVKVSAFTIAPSVDIPNQSVHISSLEFQRDGGLWTLEGKPYSGQVVSYFPDSSIQQRFSVLDGKKENEAVIWYPDGHYRELAYYHQGKLHGAKKNWATGSDHLLISHLNYHMGKGHGVQKKWYDTGQLFKKINLHMGREEGIQQAFRKNGDIYVNYEAKAGRIFGLKKSALCFELDDEKVQNEK